MYEKFKSECCSKFYLVAEEEAKSPTKKLLDPPKPIERDYTILSKPTIDPSGESHLLKI